MVESAAEMRVRKRSEASVIRYQLLVIGYLGNFAVCCLFLFLISHLFQKAERWRPVTNKKIWADARF